MLTLTVLALFWALTVTFGGFWFLRMVNVIELRTRLEALEARLAATLEQCEELLEESKRQRRSASAAASRAKGAAGAGGADVGVAGAGGAPLSPEEELRLINEFYARKGNPWSM